MVIKTAKKKRAVRKVSAKPKKIDWAKYVGKIKFPDDFLTSIRAMRDGR
jgi:hypothetical protein